AGVASCPSAASGGRELPTGSPSSSRPCRLRRRSRREAATRRSLAEAGTCRTSPLPGHRPHRLGFGRPASRLPQPLAPPGPRNTLARSKRRAPRRLPSQRLAPAAAAFGLYTIGQRPHQEIDAALLCYSGGTRRRSGRAGDRPRPTRVCPPAATPWSLRSSSSHVSPASAQDAAELLEQHRGLRLLGAAAAPPRAAPASSRPAAVGAGEGGGIVDASCKDASAYYSNIAGLCGSAPSAGPGDRNFHSAVAAASGAFLTGILTGWRRLSSPRPEHLAVAGRWERGKIEKGKPAVEVRGQLRSQSISPPRAISGGSDAGANLRQQQQQRFFGQSSTTLRPGLAAAPADGEYQRVTVRESLASLRARNALPMTAGRPASAAAAATASQQRPLHLGGRLVWPGRRARGPRCTRTCTMPEHQRRWRRPGRLVLRLVLRVQYRRPARSPHPTPCPPWSELSARREVPRSAPLAARRATPCGGSAAAAARRRAAPASTILNEMQNFRHMDSDVDIAAASLRSSRPPPPPPPQHRQQQPPPPPPAQHDCLRRPCRYRPGERRGRGREPRPPAGHDAPHGTLHRGLLLDGSAGYDRLARLLLRRLLGAGGRRVHLRDPARGRRSSIALAGRPSEHSTALPAAAVPGRSGAPGANSAHAAMPACSPS
uniref:Protein kinase domain-containing protein n=1 Tax=Macrostomum lignano TaxID=282301 RepID=A0A1I8FHU4_9PLAT